jgi:hypothetical protein
MQTSPVPLGSNEEKETADQSQFGNSLCNNTRMNQAIELQPRNKFILP